MKRIFAWLLAVVCFSLPLAVSAISAEEQAVIFERVRWHGGDAEEYAIGAIVPYLNIYQLDDPYLDYEALFAMDGKQIVTICKDGIPAGYAVYDPQRSKGERIYGFQLGEDTYTKLLQRYGDGVLKIYGGNSPFVILPEQDGPMVYRERTVRAYGAQDSSGVPFADFMLCLTCEGKLRGTPWSISESDGIYSEKDIATARDYWENKELWDKRLYEEKTKGYIPTWLAVLIMLGVTGGILGVILLGIKCDARKKMGLLKKS